MAEENGKKKLSPAALITVIIGSLIAIVAGVLFGTGGESEEEAAETAETIQEVQVHYIDVGQGDSILIKSGEDTLLIDCGDVGKDDEVSAYLEKLGVTQIDYLVGTHPHADHLGGMDKIVASYDIGEIILPHLDEGDVPTTKYFERLLTAIEEKGYSVTEAEIDRVIKIGDAECKIIAPCSDDYKNANNYSVGIIMHHGENSFIFTGDAEKLAEKEMIDGGKLEDIDVYKAGHHGSDTSSSEEFLEIIKPDIAVISVGEGNKYGHPCDITLENLGKYTDKVYRTDESGSIVISSDGEKLTVTEEKER